MNNQGDKFDPDLGGGAGKKKLIDGVSFSKLPPLHPQQKLMFYLPVLFVKESPRREVLWTPFYKCIPESVTVYDEAGDPQGTLPATNHEDTVTPFNAKLAFTTNCMQINLPNFVRDFADKRYPRLYNLTASIPPNKLAGFGHAPPMATDGFGTELTSVSDYGAKTSLLGSGSAGKEKIAKANSLIMPCDNGLFRPYFPLLVSGSSTTVNALQGDTGLEFVDFNKANPFLDYQAAHFTPASGSHLDKFVSDKGVLDFSLITLNDMMYQGGTVKMPNGDLVSPAAKMQQLPPELAYLNGDPFAAPGAGIFGASPYWPHIFPRGLTANLSINATAAIDPYILNALGAITAVGIGLVDNSSNMVSFFSISQMYYGERINPGSMIIRGRLGLVKSDASENFKTP